MVPMSAVSKHEDETETTTAAVEKPSFAARFKAWWNGVDAEPANDEAGGDGSPDAESKSESVPFTMRLRAWWHGDDVAGNKAGEDGSEASSDSSKETPDSEDADSGPQIVKTKAERIERWTNERMTIVEKVWGDGMLTPGGSELVLRLVNPLGLNQLKQLLEIGPGLGGAARAIASEYDTYVTGFEPDPTLAATGKARSNDKGMGKRAIIEPYTATALDKCRTRFDGMFSKEALYLIEDKATLFKFLPRLLKPRGEIVFTDYMLAEPDSKDPALVAWLDGEPSTPHPWQWSQYEALCKKNRLDVRVHEDVTAEYCGFIVNAWRTFQSTLSVDLAPGDARVVMDEIALWQRRRMALESGALRVLRVHAFAP
jgi:cyclopropane fatty-acyl-phospholipid synthase-like methyltransferase